MFPYWGSYFSFALRDDEDAESTRHRPAGASAETPRESIMKTILIAAALILSTGAAAMAQQATSSCYPYTNSCATTADGQTYQTYYYPYTNSATTTGPNGTSNTYYYPYTHSATTTTPYGTYNTYYYPYTNSATTTGPNGYQQQCYYYQYTGTVQCY